MVEYLNLDAHQHIQFQKTQNSKHIRILCANNNNKNIPFNDAQTSDTPTLVSIHSNMLYSSLAGTANDIPFEN